MVDWFSHPEGERKAPRPVMSARGYSVQGDSFAGYRSQSRTG